MNTQEMDFKENFFDVIVDAERIEHDNRFRITIKELFRVCRPGGHIIITTRSWGAFPPHDYPSDYWRFMDTVYGTSLSTADLNAWLRRMVKDGKPVTVRFLPSAGNQ
jgi:2-polyprenyl-3-methyl-5-hydroxy-6-metoxy-1,4-benzoquinol methylase